MQRASAGPLAPLGAGFRLLGRHPHLTLGIAALGTLLSGLVPLLQLRLGLPDDLVVGSALGFAAMVPLELYFVPRLLARLDAETADRPENPAAAWKDRFEERWLKAFGARLLLSLAVGLGLVLIIPSLVVLLLFGWAPLRVLLRGESLGAAMRGSMALMARTWPRVVAACLALLGGCLMVLILLGAVMGAVLPEPTLRQQLLHPAVWAERLTLMLLSLWISASLLALYQAAESALETPREDA